MGVLIRSEKKRKRKGGNREGRKEKMKRPWSEVSKKQTKNVLVVREYINEKSVSVRNCSPTHWVTAPLCSCTHCSHSPSSFSHPFAPLGSSYSLLTLTLFILFPRLFRFLFTLKNVPLPTNIYDIHRCFNMITKNEYLRVTQIFYLFLKKYNDVHKYLFLSLKYFSYCWNIYIIYPIKIEKNEYYAVCFLFYKYYLSHKFFTEFDYFKIRNFLK